MEPISPELEHSFYVGNAFGSILYGLQLYMSFYSIYLLSHNRNPKHRTPRNIYILYSVSMIILMAFALSANVLMGQLMWIDHRNYPGGPLGYFSAQGAIWFNVLGSAADIFADILSNALLIYRCYIIWNKSLTIIIFPSLLFLGATAMAMMALVQSALPGSSFFVQQAVNYAVPWLSLTCGLNFLVTCLIAGRIIYFGRIGQGAFSNEAARFYTGTVAILIESALPFTLLGIVFAVLLGKGLPEELSFSVIWGIFVAISPQLIILRVAMGRGWTEDTASQFGGNSTVVATDSSSTSSGKNNFYETK
ncbi:hypothetical protein M422DRAFT_171524 [Sphaerobolus stellatus SS14]|uniref:Uncharacterized protein n=1 Tax=Sphaerobolus stellatus (strain SS14) TaxID=990650 RepID=A0A0C9VKD3_SPHS4|nr:hypothetical protein M422DRAFT_171524 [Sphaerobolus stellatus SS14]